MIGALRVLLLFTPGMLAPAVTAQIRIPRSADKPNLFLAGWIEELLSRDVPAALACYQQAANDETRPRSQRALALARLGEQYWIEGRGKELEATYQTLAGLGIDLGIDRGNPILPTRDQELTRLSKQFGEALGRPPEKGRDAELGRLRRQLDNYLDKIRGQHPNPRRVITLRPLVQRVVQHERQPREAVDDRELQALLEERLKALQQGDLEAARQLLQQIKQKRNQLPARNVSIRQRMLGKRMAWITELHLRHETETAVQREHMLFLQMSPKQKRAVDVQMRRLRRPGTTDARRFQALAVVRQRVQHIASRPAISQWEREVLEELDAQLAEYALDDEAMEALELVARLPYRYELLKDLVPR